METKEYMVLHDKDQTVLLYDEDHTVLPRWVTAIKISGIKVD